MSEQKSVEAGTTPQDLERVRDILFGGIVRDHNNRFSSLQRDLERLQKALDRTNEQLAAQEAEQNRKLQEAQRALQESTDELRAETRTALDQLTSDKVDREQLGNLLIEMGNQLKGTGSLNSVLDGLLQGVE